jgi:hypothetical protein
MGVERKTIGELFDQLVTVDIRCWMSQDKIMDENLSDQERLQAAILAQKSNARRTQLIKAIDRLAGDGDITGFTKSYDRG